MTLIIQVSKRLCRQAQATPPTQWIYPTSLGQTAQPSSYPTACSLRVYRNFIAIYYQHHHRHRHYNNRQLTHLIASPSLCPLPPVLFQAKTRSVTLSPIQRRLISLRPPLAPRSILLLPLSVLIFAITTTMSMRMMVVIASKIPTNAFIRTHLNWPTAPFRPLLIQFPRNFKRS